MIGTGLAACSSDPGGNSTAREPTPLSANPAALARFFGSGLTVRSGGSFGLDRAELLPDSDPVLGRLLRVRYPARSASPSVARQYGRPQGGAQVYLELRTGPVDSLHLRYYVRFPNDFDFVKGGKLPGLYGGTVTSGRRIPDGEDGLSTRYMWRAHGAAEVYAYLPTSVAHGTSLGRGSWDWPLGSWVCVEQAVRLNRPGRLDGNVTVHVDGREVLSQNGLEFRTSDRLGIDGVLFSTFFGGSDPSWATPRAQHADFAAFAVSEQPIDPLQGV
ncbi:polysaccharide lyase [Streptomyces sp. NPDC002144]|uniref:polysaccharide lyase n=1 Tax=Streptomyces sp. NPDC006668 TaxID=3156903 RepID=UPI0033FCBFEB